MKLKELKCKNCGAVLSVEENAKIVKCKFCQTEFYVEDSYNEGYSFAKGLMDARSEGHQLPLIFKIIFGIFFSISLLMISLIGFKVISGSSEFDVNDFNFTFEYVIGTQTKFFIDDSLDEVITSNKINKDHIITVIYNDIKTSDPDKITEIKHSLEETVKYEVSVDYDKKGYINQMKIEKLN